jgi:hypothetical protein
VEIDFPNADNQFLPGMMGVVEMPLQPTAPNSLIVPLSCVIPRFQDPRLYDRVQTFVFIVRDGKAYKKRADVSFADGKNAEIWRGELQANDLVITNPDKLINGAPVKVEKAP